MVSTAVQPTARRRRGAVAIATALIGAACLAAGSASASPSPYAPDLPLKTKVCKLDTSPSYPSCSSHPH
jgi:hypothetical protein